MPSNEPRMPLVLRPRPSRVLAMFLLIVHGAALVAILWSALPLTVQVLIGLWVVGSLAFHWRVRVLRRGRRTLLGAEWLPDGDWVLSFSDGAVEAGQLSGDSIVLPWLLILNFRCQQRGRVNLILPSDALDIETARELRVRLRTDGLHAPADVDTAGR